jgi:hypothetical protein
MPETRMSLGFSGFFPDGKRSGSKFICIDAREQLCEASSSTPSHFSIRLAPLSLGFLQAADKET